MVCIAQACPTLFVIVWLAAGAASAAVMHYINVSHNIGIQFSIFFRTLAGIRCYAQYPEKNYPVNLSTTTQTTYSAPPTSLLYDRAGKNQSQMFRSWCKCALEWMILICTPKAFVVNIVFLYGHMFSTKLMLFQEWGPIRRMKKST